MTIGKQTLLLGDCRDLLPQLGERTVDVVVSSPQYNLGLKYNSTADDLPRQVYLDGLGQVFQALYRVLKADGSFFLNVGFSSVDPWVGMDVAQVARQHFVLQNNISWVKSISIDQTTHGHFKPINSPRFINGSWEHLFHFTRTGKVPVDRLAIGVPYTDPSNLTRGTRGKNGNNRCRGNTWFLPYETINNKMEKGEHPAVFPEKLVEQCLRLHGLRDDLVVLDPYVGSGTVLAVCQRLGVNGIGIDIDKNYLEFAAARLQQDPGTD